MQNQFKVAWIVQNTFEYCFKVSRLTQVEDLLDPYTNSNVAESTNTVASAVYWNAVATMTILFIYLYDDFAGKTGISNSIPGAAVSTLLIGVIIIVVMSSLSLGMVSNLDMILPMVSMIVYMVFLFVQLYMGFRDSEIPDSVRVISKKIMFWGGYLLVMPSILVSYNVLMQRRDANFNWSSAVSMLVYGLTIISSECFFTYVGISREKARSGAESSVETTDGKSDTQSHGEKHIFFSVISVSAVLQAASIIITNQASLPNYAFDSTYNGLCTALPIMIGISLFQISRHMVADARDQKGSLAWLHTMMCTEILARTIFTMCVAYDLRSLSMEDNVPIG